MDVVKKKKFRFDYLIISSGSKYALPFKEQDVVLMTRAEHLLERYEKLKKAKRVLVAGGGLVGVELVGEILDKYKDKEIIIVHAKERLLERNNFKAGEYARIYFENNGVEVIFNRRLKNMKGKFCVLDDGKRIDVDMVFLCTGITPNYNFMKNKYKNYLDEKGNISVSSFLNLKNRENIFVCGDVAGVKEEKTAQNAERQAAVVVKNIFALENGLPLKNYQIKQNFLVISLGKYRGILSRGNFVLTGVVPALMKFLIEKKEMVKKLYL